MLDQNTDRMWYVIGAVIIGAAIILIMNQTFPQLFASIGETFESKTESTMEMTDGIMPKIPAIKYLGRDDLTMSNAVLLDYNADTNTFDVEVRQQGAWQGDGFYTASGRFGVAYGEVLKLSYDIFIPEGVTGLVAVNDINSRTNNGGEWRGNDNDDRAKRVHNGVNDVTYSVPLAAGEWTTVWFSYSNTDVLNVNQETLYDVSRFGVRNTTGSPLVVKIRNVRIQIY